MTLTDNSLGKQDAMGHSFKHTVSITFVHQFIMVLKAKGIDTNVLVKNAGISENLLKHSESRITPQQFSSFIKEVVFHTGDEFLNCGVEPVLQGHFKEMAKQSIKLANLHLVYLHLCNFYNDTIEWLKVNLHIAEEYAEIRFQWLQEQDAIAIRLIKEITTILWHRFPSWLIGRNVKMKQVRMDFAKPNHSTEYSLMYPCEVTFNSKSLVMRIEKSNLDMPVVQTPKTLVNYLRAVPLNWFSKQVYLPSINKKVISIIENSNTLGTLTIEDISRQLNICSRTLRRKLDQSDTSFQSIKDGIRRDIAIQMLLDNKSLSEIAEYTNFSDVSAFSRAFKKWTGIPPSAYLK